MGWNVVGAACRNLRDKKVCVCPFSTGQYTVVLYLRVKGCDSTDASAVSLAPHHAMCLCGDT